MGMPPIPKGYIVPGIQLDRRLQILLAFGIIGPMRRHQIQRIAAPDLSREGLAHHLKMLRKSGHLWMEPLSDPFGQKPINRAFLYALTQKGSTLLREYVGIPKPPSPRDRDRLITKEGALESTQRAIHSHMLDQAEFITRLISDLRALDRFVGIDVWPEYTALGHIRIDALIIIRYSRQGALHALPANKRSARWMPWLIPDDTYPLDDRFHEERLFALEIDRTTEELSVIREKGADYRTAYATGLWRDLLGTFPIPTFVVKSETRLANIHQAFNRGWWNSQPPQGRACCYAATFKRLPHSIVDGYWVDDVGATISLWGDPWEVVPSHLPIYGLRS
ncbi:replication-relaxation family protein [Herpetosiphon geysericola]|uniref:Uncharacterized protein n=1 Tax=Herpetosiphon geysericola TaxID=70996 RepID=A0A0P6XTN4_9CHLR|nr:replication-relaxation family protein [Herpetosiphon geysericola]KPL79951.1 hypothetical protein SE18_25515 [Herpetosiphon geysericola]